MAGMSYANRRRLWRRRVLEGDPVAMREAEASLGDLVGWALEFLGNPASRLADIETLTRFRACEQALTTLVATREGMPAPRGPDEEAQRLELNGLIRAAQVDLAMLGIDIWFNGGIKKYTTVRLGDPDFPELPEGVQTTLWRLPRDPVARATMKARWKVWALQILRGDLTEAERGAVYYQYLEEEGC